MRTSSLLLLLTIALTGCASHKAPPQTAAQTIKRPPLVPPPIATPIDPALNAQARRELDWALNASDELVRAHAIEEQKNLNPTDAGSIAFAKLGDSSRLVRKAAALAAGELEYHPAQ